MWARFAYKIAVRTADYCDGRRGEGHIRRRSLTKPLRMIVAVGAGSGESTAIRVLVRARREKTEQILARSSVVRDDKRTQARMKYNCILSSPAGAASFQMKYGAATAQRRWGVSPFNFLSLKRGNVAVKRPLGWFGLVIWVFSMNSACLARLSSARLCTALEKCLRAKTLR